MNERKMLAEKVFKIGVQRLWRNHDNTYYVSIHNRTYSSSVRISEEKAKIWLKILGGEKC